MSQRDAAGFAGRSVLRFEKTELYHTIAETARAWKKAGAALRI